MPLSETRGQERSGFLEKIITAAQSSYNVMKTPVGLAVSRQTI